MNYENHFSMARKKLILSNNFPYHIIARSNNRENFYLEEHLCWDIFNTELAILSTQFNFKIHSFVMMSNHYHLLGSTQGKYSLPIIMEYFQKSINRKINSQSGRINHLFGRPYKACIIQSPLYYYHALKYVYRNPVTARIVSKVENYQFSSLNNSSFVLTNPPNGIDELIPSHREDFLKYLNNDYSIEAYGFIRKALNRTRFNFSSRVNKKVASELNL